MASTKSQKLEDQGEQEREFLMRDTLSGRLTFASRDRRSLCDKEQRQQVANKAKQLSPGRAQQTLRCEYVHPLVVCQSRSDIVRQVLQPH